MSELIINLLPVASGGGLQNAMSFLMASDLRGKSVYCRSGLGLEDVARLKGAKVFAYSGRLGRLLGEIGMAKKCRRGDRVFTLFGPPPFFTRSGVINITGCAYSNLFYPEVSFWVAESALRRLVRYAIDAYRKIGLARADYWIFETEAMRNRACGLFRFDPTRCEVILMSPGHWASKMLMSSPAARQDSEFRVLYLTGEHPNKRINALIPIAYELARRGNSDVRFVLSLDSTSNYANLVRREHEAIANYFVFLGRINPRNVPDVVLGCDAMCNLAVLESFSNNFVESWAGRKPLIVTDAEWSRSVCEDAAVYVDPSEPSASADHIERLQRDESWRGELVAAGLRILQRLPTTETRVHQYWKVIGCALEPAARTEGSVWGRR